MRKGLLLALSVVLVAALAAPSFAVSLSVGETLAKIRDHSCMYDQEGNPIGFLPGTYDPGQGIWIPAGFQMGTEQRTIFQVTTIYDNGGNPEFDSSSPTELTGLLYDLKVIGIHQVGGPTSQSFVLDFGLAARNPLTATGADVDGDSIGAINPVSGLPIVFGGVMEVYEDSTKDYTADPGGIGRLDSILPAASVNPLPAGNAPSYWVEGQPTNVRDSFVNVSDGSLWLSAQLVELQYMADIGIIGDPALGGLGYTAGTLLRETIDVSDGTGDGQAFLNVFGGSAEGAIERGFAGGLADMGMLFDVNLPWFDIFTGMWNDTFVYQGPGYWTVDSQDPIVFSVIPEPATISLLGLGLVGIATLRRRRKK